ncbi:MULTISPECIES: Gfo/Idh/MocA family protein [Rhizobium/Agrobacterium group]|uniref:NAD binding oxidoreductase n=2 Tax=Rhizobium/Agrobacterium group TaxID=227290 RepID=B9JSR4_ALLAM|nr:MULTISPECIES: Gfo/Idh/MocA family oxidoreductase [Rhizobium/Agrobacterium group]ACM37757.1 NAD binding oxidoreductase [Allorhizobium ampelinum S4]MCF1482481.1 Gfo/Idh/MocA family oxidoreductase [Allorhizobium ampelinum]MUO29224.1 gfo/Idh/MocA family oxidoreductase [Agrobacterium vitis]MUO43676.1 gfo/Idh/MocA family oxidoreductase [Agrobacterium vitis]MUP11727.1 gfo/Idh/MocA family oxidoreductase [Agrobacterium vitis]
MTIEASKSEQRAAKIRLGMVGGGQGAFIGAVHRMAARLDDHYDLVAGALSSTPEKSLASGRDLGLDPTRCYGSFEEMAEKEAARPDGIEAVSIVTPNHMHYPAAKAFLERGIHVICDKPLTSNLDDAKKLKEVADKAKALFILTHNYTGYPMVRHARELVQNGELGEIRLVQMEYPQDWLAEPVEQTGAKQAVWRTDPAQSGVGGSTGDIGTHAYNLGSFISGLELEELAADVHTFVEGRRLDDNAHVMLRFQGGAKGLLWCSQVATGNENGLKVRIYGTKAGIEWTQADPNYLWYTKLGEPKQLITRGGAGAGGAAARVTRIPGGHPEGYLEAFATIYSEAAQAILAARTGAAVDPDVVYPTVDDGVKGVAFVTACIESSKQNGAWVRVSSR